MVLKPHKRIIVVFLAYLLRLDDKIAMTKTLLTSFKKENNKLFSRKPKSR